MSGSAQLEIERKYDVRDHASLPRLHGVRGVSQVRYRPPVTLEAVYFDTSDRVLAAHGITLRRRRGGPDAGWHVKAEHGDHRIELHEPLRKADLLHDQQRGPEQARADVPAAILDLAQVHLRGAGLVPVLSMNTLRAVVDLYDHQGERLAEVADDQVAAMAAGLRADARVRHWREWEVEIIGPGILGGAEEVEAFLDSVETTLQGAGAVPSAAGSKLEKVLGRPENPLGPEAAGTGGDLLSVLQRTVRAQVQALKSWDPLVRRDVDDSVHQLRVSARTLRSVLQIYAPLFEDEARTRVEKSLKKLGRLLSDARDAEVVRDEAEARIAALSGGADGAMAALVPAKVVRRLRKAKEKEYRAAHRELVRALRSPWYWRQLDQIDAFARDTPLRPDLAAEQRDDAVAALAPLVAVQADAVLELAGRTAEGEPSAAERDLLHEVRKEAKRLRYAVKPVQSAAAVDFGPELTAKMRTAKKLQEALGVHRDSVLFQEHVRATARRARKDGEDTFAYGLLYAAEARIQEKALAKAAKRIRRLAEQHAAGRE